MDQDVAVGYKAKAAEVADNVAIKTNAKIIYFAFFTLVKSPCLSRMYVHDCTHVIYGFLEKI
jgi:hypothetical protein